MNTIFWVVEVGVQMTNPSAGVIQPIICGSGNPKQDIPWHFTKDTFYFLGIRDLKKDGREWRWTKERLQWFYSREITSCLENASPKAQYHNQLRKL